MTVHDAQETLLAFFLENDVFDPAVDIDNVLEKGDLEAETNAAIYQAALHVLAEEGIIRPIYIGDQIRFALAKPLAMRLQTVDIPFPLARAISNTINNYDLATGGKGQLIQSFSINTDAVGALVQVIEQLNNIIRQQGEPKS